MGWKEQLIDSLNCFYNVTELNLQVADSKGEVFANFGDSCSYCEFLCNECNQTDNCQKSHKSAFDECASLGDSYIFGCHGGLVCIATPVWIQAKVEAYVLAGPLSLDYISMDLIDDIVKSNDIDVPLRARLFRYATQVDIIDTSRTRYISKLLKLLVSKLDNNIGYFQNLQNGKQAQQAKIGEYIQLIKNTPQLTGIRHDIENQLVDTVLKGDKELASSILTNLLGQIYYASGNNTEIIKSRSIELIALMSRALVEKEADKERIYQITDDALHTIAYTKTLTDLSYLLLDIVEKFIDIAFSRLDSIKSSSIKKALRYIEKNYCNTVSLKEVADYVGLNSAYFSSLFKKELNMTFSSYIIKKRIDEGKHLLSATNLSLTEIAMALGFDSHSYFSNVFKAHTGMTPKQYRRSNY